MDDLGNLDDLFGAEEPNNDEPIVDNIDNDDSDLDNGLKGIFEDSDPEPSSDEDKSVIDKFLSSKGIVDSKIKMIDEYNDEVEVNFKDLSEEEQLDLLQSLTTETRPPLNDSQDALFLNELHKQGVTMEQFLEYYKGQVIEELQMNSPQNYEIDSYDDRELFLLDLTNKFDLTEEELQSELEKELENEDLFKRKVDKIREEYKQLEAQAIEEERFQFEQQQQEQYNNFADNMMEVANNIQDFHGLELDNEDINNTLSYMLNLDSEGMSQMSRDLNNPEVYYKVAWYLRHGEDAIKMIENAYEQEISRLKKLIDKPTVVKRTNQNNDNNGQYRSIHELH